MKSMIVRLRVAVALVAVVTAIIGVGPTGVSASHTNSGDYIYEDVGAGTSKISNPAAGICYLTGTLALSATNNTNAPATIYTDDYCSSDGTVVGPGNSTATPHGSVRFEKA